MPISSVPLILLATGTVGFMRSALSDHWVAARSVCANAGVDDGTSRAN
jgi:hypothetical protein